MLQAWERCSRRGRGAPGVGEVIQAWESYSRNMFMSKVICIVCDFTFTGFQPFRFGFRLSSFFSILDDKRKGIISKWVNETELCKSLM